MADHLHGADGDDLTVLPATMDGLRQAVAGAHDALDHIAGHLDGEATVDAALECCQANIHDLQVSLATWQTFLERTRHLNRRRN